MTRSQTPISWSRPRTQGPLDERERDERAQQPDRAVGLMRVAVPAETRPDERRVALVPEVIGRLTAAGYAVTVQAGAGRGAFLADQDYRDAGAEVCEGPVLAGADVVVSVE